MVVWFVPVLLLLSLGNIRPSRLALWIGGVTVVLAALAVYDIARGAERDDTFLSWVIGGRSDRHIWPSPMLVFFTTVGLFIAQALVAAGDNERRIIAAYPAYFDAAWKAGVQLALSAAFVALFWILLWLGAALFNLIKIEFLEKLIEHRWFAMPATTLALACALHVTDAHVQIVRGMRTLIHILLSWLLPLLTLVVAGFLASLPFTGLAPLWKTHFATTLLLATAAALLVLVNAAYKDGDAADRPGSVLRHAASLAAVMLVPLVALAAYALGLRVDQYGWSTDRVIATGVLLVAACYALGYAFAAVPWGDWLKRIETVNIVASLLTLGVLLALFSPAADPARIAVASQVARLKAGRMTADKFDYVFLRFDGARYGKAALEELKSMKGADAPAIRRHVEVVERMRFPSDDAVVAPTPREAAASITVYPAGRALPESFLTQDWSSSPQWAVPRCLRNTAVRCDAFLADLDGDGVEEVVMVTTTPQDWQAVAFQQDAHGRWHVIGRFQLSCSQVRHALHAGQFKVVVPQWRDLEAAGKHLRLSVEDDSDCS